MRNMSNSKAKTGDSKACDLCTGAFKASDEILRCEGHCKKSLHHYCAGISRQHYKTLTDNSTPFVCLVCTQLQHNAEIQMLLSEIEVLKSECQELRAELRATRADTPATPTLAGNESTQPAAFQVLKKDVEQLQATVEAQSKSYAAALKTGGRSKAQSKKKSRYDKTNRTMNNQSESSQTSSVKHSPSKHSSSKPKVPVSGARKVWGTMRETSASAVIATLTKLTSMSSEQVQARRKFKSINGKSNHTRWWFVLRGDEDILSILESEWEQVQLQTNWKLEPLLKFSDSDELAVSVIHAEDHSNPNSNSESFLDQ